MNRPFLASFLSFSLGIFLGHLVKIPFIIVILLACSFLVSSIFFIRHTRLFTALFLISVAFVGAACLYNFTYIPKDNVYFLAQGETQEVYLCGKVASDPELRTSCWGKRRFSFIFEAESYMQI